MRADGTIVQNGSNGFGNGTSTPRSKKGAISAVNGHSLNGSSNAHTNGSSMRRPPTPHAMYQTHDRKEVVRILMQSLNEMGYIASAQSLSDESGYEIESPQIVQFRNAILEGHWSTAEDILCDSYRDGYDEEPEMDDDRGIVLAEGADRDEMLFLIRKQKFLEFLAQRDLGQALTVLRQELTPLNQDTGQLHYLSGLLMCPAEELGKQNPIFIAPEKHRDVLLHDLTSAIAPSEMIRDHRLSELLDQVKRGQINDCLYHNTSASPSLYSDHYCERDHFPLRTFMELSDHLGEVWYLQFSPDGTKLATASSDKSVIIYETEAFQVLHRLDRHDRPVTYLAWSPNNEKIISCSMDKQARVWDVESGRLFLHADHQTPDDTHLSAAAWHPDSKSFITSSFDRKTPLCHWSLLEDSNGPHLIHKWSEGLRLADCAVTKDGRRVIAIDSEQCLYVFDFETYEEEYRIPFLSKLTCLTVSDDCKSVLVNLCSGEVDLVDIATGDTIRRFEGQKQGNFIIRSTFGGAAENFVLSGSEDGKIYIWHKENGRLIETLRGHGQGEKKTLCVNAVSWNPMDAGMFASAGDDHKIRIWTSSVLPNEAVPSAHDRQLIRQSFGRASGSRSTHRDSNL